MRPRLSTLVPRLGLFACRLLPVVLLVACAHDRPAPPVAPSAVGVIRAVSGAQSAAARLAPHVTPEGKPALQSLEQALAQAQAEIARYEALVEEQSKARQEAEASALYWQGKQEKALKELWFWRGIALIAAAGALAAVGLRTGWKFAL